MMTEGKHWYKDCFRSQEWRLNHLYWIERKDKPPCRFKMNWAQEQFFRGMHKKNNILKARQLGMSTLTAMLILDGCLFNPRFHAGINDKAREDAEEKLRKIKFAADCLLDPPAEPDSDIPPDELELIKAFARSVHAAMKPNIKVTRGDFANGSDIRTGTSLRGGTFNLLHVSEFGHVAATAPKKAQEIITGTLPTAEKGIIIMESTHEGGKFGENYRMTKTAMEKVGAKLEETDYKFFFFAWHGEPTYRAESDQPLRMTQEQADYFKALEDDGIALDDAQKRWYLAQWAVYGYHVRQEYPSTPEEAFETRVEGSIYGTAIGRLRAEGRIAATFEVDGDVPVYVSWDIGLSDSMSLWLIQYARDGRFYAVDHYSANNQPLSHYVGVVRRWEAIHGQPVALNLLPHDAAKRDIISGASFEEQVRRQGLPCRTVPRVSDVWVGIDMTRRLLRRFVFHKRCSEPVLVEGVEHMSGVNALENYQTSPPGANGVERSMPLHNECSHSADAFRTFVEAYEKGIVTCEKAPERPFSRQTSRRAGMARGANWA